MDRTLLVEHVKARAPLWDNRLKEYHNRDLKPKLWKEIGNELNVEGDAAHKAWELLRDTFRRKLKELKNSTSSRERKASCRWPHFESMSFLIDVMKPRETSDNPLAILPNLNSLKEETEDTAWASDVSGGIDSNEEEDVYEPEIRDIADLSATISSEESQMPSKVAKPPKKRRAASEAENEALTLDRRKVSLFDACYSPMSQKEEEDDDLFFFKSLLPSMKSLSPLVKMRLRSSILNCVIDALEAASSVPSHSAPQP